MPKEIAFFIACVLAWFANPLASNAGEAILTLRYPWKESGNGVRIAMWFPNGGTLYHLLPKEIENRDSETYHFVLRPEMLGEAVVFLDDNPVLLSSWYQ